MKNLKNYYLYFYNGKVCRQAINLNDIYPEIYAENKIPRGGDIFARIITSDTSDKKWSGYRVKGLKSSWLKHTMWTDYYPEVNVKFEDAILYHEAQLNYINKYIPLLLDDEVKLLQESTDKIKNRLWTDV